MASGALLLATLLVAQLGAAPDDAPAEAPPVAPLEAPDEQAPGEQTPDAAPTIAAVVVEGAKDEAARAAVAGVFGVKAGDALDLARVRLGIKRVLLTGAWADVRVWQDTAADGRVALFVQLVPDVVVRELIVRAAAPLPQEAVKDAVGLEVGQRFRPERLVEAKERLHRLLADLGYPRAAVAVAVKEVGDDERVVEVTVTPGRPVLLSRLIIDGDPPMSRAEIEALLHVEEGTAFDRTRVEAGLQSVKQLLLRRRHLGVKVGVASVENDAGGDRAQVTVMVQAGPRYHVRFVGNQLLSSAMLHTVMHEGKIEGLDPMALARARAHIENVYRLAGYARVGVTLADVPAAPPLDDDAERELHFVVSEGPRAEVSEVKIEGARAHQAAQLVEEVWRTVEAETPDLDLLQPVDPGDLAELLEFDPGQARKSKQQPRAVEVSDQRLELLPRPMLRRKPVYVERAFAEAARRITDLYRADGFLDATVQGPLPEFSSDGTQIRVRYQVREGARVTVAGVRFLDVRPCAVDGSCATPLKLATLLEQLSLEPGAPASYAAVADARATVERNLQDAGHPFARVTEEVHRVEGKPELDVVFRVDPGARVTIGKIRTRGNQVTQDLVILDRVTLAPGDLYSATEVERSRQRLSRLGLFSSVTVELFDDDPRATRRDLLVVVRERPLFAVEVGAGASVEDGPRAFLAGEVRNIAGLGVAVHGRGQVNYPRAFYEFLYDKDDPNNPLNRFPPAANLVDEWGRFLEGQAVLTSELPKVYGMPFDTRLHVDGIGMREIRPAFTLNRGSIGGGIDTQPAPWLNVSPAVDGEISDFDCPNNLSFGVSCGEGSIGLVRRTDAGNIRQTTYRMALSSDLRDSPVRPRSGLWLSGVTDLALGSGNLRRSSDAGATPVVSDFVKLTGSAVGYLPLAPGFLWALSGRVGNIFPFGDSYIPLYKRFYLGGTSTVRGFREDEVLPADDDRWPASSRLPIDQTGPDALDPRQSLGGNFFLDVRSELRIAVVGDVELSTFVDVGQLLEDVRQFDAVGFAAGAGIGLRYNTPVGPFVVDLGWKVVDGRRRLPALQTLDRLNLHLSIGFF
ncbi:MAG: BamA/TamA family outer membrane protein [Deltaproteobacteria bacterium]|nr:BamA/TamA family outer membrane protein [Deltaproteobacteria bacterium]